MGKSMAKLDIIYYQVNPQDQEWVTLHRPVVKGVLRDPSNITGYCQCYWEPSTT